MYAIPHGTESHQDAAASNEPKDTTSGHLGKLQTFEATEGISILEKSHAHTRGQDVDCSTNQMSIATYQNADRESSKLDGKERKKLIPLLA
jgi:hypothetical protein